MNSKNSCGNNLWFGTKSFLLFLFISTISFAQDLPDIEPVLDENGLFLTAPLEIAEAAALGATPVQAIEEFGVPVRLFPMRGEVEWQDDVVFFYGDYLYLYWYKDRVWQLRYDYRYEEQIAGLRMGMTIDEVTSLLSAPHYTGTSSIYYNLLDKGFPARMRLYFDEGILHDIYIYRSDF